MKISIQPAHLLTAVGVGACIIFSISWNGRPNPVFSRQEAAFYAPLFELLSRQDKALQETDTLPQNVALISQADLEKIKLELDRAHFQIEQSRKEIEKNQVFLQEVRENLERSKKEIKNYRELIELLEKDGLIDTSKEYEIRIKDGELYINGEKQSNEKFRKYIKNDGLIRKDLSEKSVYIQ